MAAMLDGSNIHVLDEVSFFQTENIALFLPCSMDPVLLVILDVSTMHLFYEFVFIFAESPVVYMGDLKSP